MSKTVVRLIVILAIAGVVGFAGYQYWLNQQNALPAGIASGNGRVEAKLVDVAAKESLRVKEVLVDEGDIVQPGELLVKMDTATLDAQLAEAKAQVLGAEEKVAVNKATIVQKKSEVELAKVELDRAQKLRAENAGSQQDVDRRKTSLEVAEAALEQENAALRTVEQQVEVAKANEATIQTRIDDAALKSPVRGRVLYRLTEVGEVLQPGGKALTLVNLEDVYMEIFLPAEQAARVKVGGEARITLDHAPGRAAAGKVSFVSPEAQFTPKQVETKSERDKLMFRVKIQAPEELVKSYLKRIKTGVRGMGYVKIDPAAEWPASLSDLLKPGELPDDEALEGEEAPSEVKEEEKPAETSPEESKKDAAPAEGGEAEKPKTETP
jgi:HlyD family secretion protein